MSEPKQHHYVPRRYLLNFCSGKRIWVRDCEKGENRFQDPKNVAKIGYYYGLEKDGKRDNLIENGLAAIEGAAYPLISELSGGGPISLEAKENLSYFLAFLTLRVPDFQQGVEKVHQHMIERTMRLMCQSEERVKQSFAAYTEKTGKSVDVDPKTLMSFVNEKKYRIDISREASLEAMLRQAPIMANYFVQMDWLILHSHGDAFFVTTDNPLVLVPPVDHLPGTWRGYGIATPGCKKIVPLSRSCCLTMMDKGDQITHADADRIGVDRINQLLASQVSRYIMGPTEALIDSLKSISDESARHRDGRFTIN